MQPMMRVVLVTGANKGIGLAIAKKALTTATDTHVVLASRNSAKGRARLFRSWSSFSCNKIEMDASSQHLQFGTTRVRIVSTGA